MDNNKPVAERCAMTVPVESETLEQTFDKFSKVAMRVKTERDDLLKALYSVVRMCDSHSGADKFHIRNLAQDAIDKATKP